MCVLGILIALLFHTKGKTFFGGEEEGGRCIYLFQFSWINS